MGDGIRANRKIATIKKRIDYLRKRVDEGHRLGRDFSYDKQECAALEWALDIAVQSVNKKATSSS